MMLDCLIISSHSFNVKVLAILNGEILHAKQISSAYILPIPANIDWSSNAAFIGNFQK